jgi:hypothetical protein
MESNVQFSIYGTSTNVVARRKVVSDTEVAKFVHGYFEVVQPTLESEIVGNSDRDRLIRHRLVVYVTDKIKETLVSGAYIGITHEKHPDTNGWAKQSKIKQYKIVTITPANHGRYMNCALVEEDKT